jgi:Flp pilus assembly protein TadG
MIFSGVELSNAVFLKQSINLAAYEAAKLITAPGNNAARAGTRVQQILLSRKVTNYTFTSTPAVTASTPTGTMITVVVSAPATNLSYGPVLIMAGKTVSSTVVMSRL